MTFSLSRQLLGTTRGEVALEGYVDVGGLVASEAVSLEIRRPPAQAAGEGAMIKSIPLSGPGGILPSRDAIVRFDGNPNEGPIVPGVAVPGAEIRFDDFVFDISVIDPDP